MRGSGKRGLETRTGERRLLSLLEGLSLGLGEVLAKSRPRPEAGPVGRGLKAWLVPLFSNSAPRATPGLWIHRQRVRRQTDGGAAQHRALGKYRAFGLHPALPLGRSRSLDRWLVSLALQTPASSFRVSQGHFPKCPPPSQAGEDWASRSVTTPPSVTNCHTGTQNASRSYCKLCRGTGHPNSQSRISPSRGCPRLLLLHPSARECFHTYLHVLGILQTCISVRVLSTCAFDIHRKFGSMPVGSKLRLSPSALSHTSPTPACVGHRGPHTQVHRQCHGP